MRHAGWSVPRRAGVYRYRAVRPVGYVGEVRDWRLYGIEGCHRQASSFFGGAVPTSARTEPALEGLAGGENPGLFPAWPSSRSWVCNISLWLSCCFPTSSPTTRAIGRSKRCSPHSPKWGRVLPFSFMLHVARPPVVSGFAPTSSEVTRGLSSSHLCGC